MGKNFTYVDNSNVYIEGCRVSAVAKGMAGARSIVDAMNNKVTDVTWHLDYGQLHAFACGSPADIGRAYLCGSPPPGDSFWTMVREHGFQVQKYDRSIAGKEKKVDVAIAHQMTKDSYSGVINRDTDEITLVAGDTDFVPVVEDLIDSGFVVHVVFWSSAAQELKGVASKFISLDEWLELLTKKWSP